MCNKMDPDISIMFQCPFPEGLAEDQVRVEISPKYNRKLLPDHEPQIAAVWDACRCEKPWLFNGAKFRIHSVALDQGVLTFRLGLTCYRDFIGTNWSSQAVELQQRGLMDCGESQAYLAEPLGVGAMLHTVDDYFVFLRRSLEVGEAQGLIDIPGGHPEPKAVVPGVPDESILLEDIPEELVVQEIFSSVLGEIRDEVNLPLAVLSQPVLLGIARNATSAGRASAEFYVSPVVQNHSRSTQLLPIRILGPANETNPPSQAVSAALSLQGDSVTLHKHLVLQDSSLPGCSLSAEQVHQCYQIGGPEAQESTSIVFVKRQDVLLLEENRDFWKELCPSAKGAAMLYALLPGR